MANNDFDSSQRETVWRLRFGYATEGYDVFGRYVIKSNFECDHIFPKSRGGRTIVSNGQPLAPLSNIEKSDNLSGIINGRHYSVTSINGIGTITVR